MADDWRPGDLALCVRDHFNSDGHPRVRPGGVYEVETAVDWFGTSGLVLRDHYSRHPSAAHASTRFRKIKPLNEAERAAAMRELNAPVREPMQ